MFPHSDNELDHLSREAAEQFQPEPTAAGWDALEKSLDKEMPTDQDRRRRRLLWLFLPFLLIGSLSGWWYLSASESNNTTATQEASAPLETNATEATKKSSTATPSEKLTSTTKPATEVSSEKDSKRSSEATVVQNIPSTNQVSTSNASDKISKQSLVANENKSAVSSASSQRLKAATNTTGNAGTSGAAISYAPSSKNQKKNRKVPAQSTFTEIAPSNESTETSYKYALIGGPKNLIERPFNIAPRAIAPLFENSGKTPVKLKPTSNFKPGFSISLVGGMDYSSIHGTKRNSAGMNTGLLFQYDLNKRFSIVTGGIFTKKYYAAMPQHFNPPKHYWTTYVTLHYVEGFCEMVDIPLNIRYNAFTKKNTRVFASTGMSSYIMTHQNYDYFYTRAGQYTHKNWDTKSQSNYWFGVANLSVGVEQKIGNKFSVQLEPYIKLPVSGVGFGQMDITSYGAMFHLKYQPRFK